MSLSSIGVEHAICEQFEFVLWRCVMRDIAADLRHQQLDSTTRLMTTTATRHHSTILIVCATCICGTSSSIASASRQCNSIDQPNTSRDATHKCQHQRIQPSMNCECCVALSRTPCLFADSQSAKNALRSLIDAKSAIGTPKSAI